MTGDEGHLHHALTLDPNADRYVARIFGGTTFSVVDNVEQLPERPTQRVRRTDGIAGPASQHSRFSVRLREAMPCLACPPGRNFAR